VTLIFSGIVNAQFVQQGSKLVGTGAVGAAHQGRSVSITADGNTAIVGGPFDSSSTGAWWVFTRNGADWMQQGSKLAGSGVVGAAQLGASVDISDDGNTAIVGGPFDNGNTGAAWIFTRSGDTWIQQGEKLVGAGTVGNAYQGESVSISADGNTAIIGGSGDDFDAGAAWVFTRSGGIWTQQGSKLVGTGAVGNSFQGVAVSLSGDGNTAIVGGNGDDFFNGTGAAWIFTRSDSVWAQQGNKLVGTGGFRPSQGSSVSLSYDGNTALIGGPGDSSDIGAVWSFTRSGGVWSEEGKLPGISNLGLLQGTSVALSAGGDTAIVGAPGFSPTGGYALCFTRSGSVWARQGAMWGTDFVSPPPAQQGFSVSLSADGTTAIAGGWADSTYAGAAWIFTSGLTATYNINVQKGWNLVSVPLTMSDYARSALFPSAISDAFYFDAGYQTSDTLMNGIGYWMKFPSTQEISLTGTLLTADSTDVSVGWNMIGGLSSPLPASNVGSNPGGIVTSEFYEFTNRYQAAPTLEPGKGYWVKVTQAGQLILNSGAGTQLSSNRICIIPMSEFPPPPPDENGIGVVEEMPMVYLLEQNYPNPFNPVTNIRYQLPSAHHVTLTVYNMLGQVVAVLVDGVQEPGYHIASVDGGSWPSGVYNYKLTTGTFTDVKKMVLLK